MAAHPADWPWSSYPGYARRRERVGWLAYEAIYSAWQGEMGGGHPEAAYRRFVEKGLASIACRRIPFGRLLAAGCWAARSSSTGCELG